MTVDRLLAGVIGRSREQHLATVIGEQPTEIREAAANVLGWVECISHFESCGGLWNQLHQAARVLRRARARFEVRFHRDDREREPRAHLILRRESANEIRDPLLVRWQIGERIGRLVSQLRR